MMATVSEKGWVVIPAELRRKYGLHPGTEVQVVDYGDVLALVPQLTEPTQEAAGMLQRRAALPRALKVERRTERRKTKTRSRQPR